MALTVVAVPDSEDVWGKHRVKAFDVTYDSSYPAGGYTVSGATFELRRILGMWFIGRNPAALGYEFVFDDVNSAIRVVVTGAVSGPGTDVPTGTNISTLITRVLVQSTDD